MLKLVSGQLTLRLSMNCPAASLSACHWPPLDDALEHTVSDERPGLLYQTHTRMMRSP